MLNYGVFSLFPFSNYPKIQYGLGKPNDVTITVDMSTFDFEKFYEEGNELRGVFVNGNFSDWCGECDKAKWRMLEMVSTPKKYRCTTGIINYIFHQRMDGRRDKENDFEEWISPGKEDWTATLCQSLRNI